MQRGIFPAVWKGQALRFWYAKRQEDRRERDKGKVRGGGGGRGVGITERRDKLRKIRIADLASASDLDRVVNCNRKFMQFPDLKFVVTLGGITQETVGSLYLAKHSLVST